jgi:hypothetical protein
LGELDRVFDDKDPHRPYSSHMCPCKRLRWIPTFAAGFLRRLKSS